MYRFNSVAYVEGVKVKLALSILILLGATATGAGEDREPPLQPYERPEQIDPLEEGTATMYRAPWRSNLRTVVAHDALAGVGLYYKYSSTNWNQQEQDRVIGQLAEAGVRRLRFAPHFPMYIHADWTGPEEGAIHQFHREMRAARTAGIRPVVVFVHIPAMGDDYQALRDWWEAPWNPGLAGIDRYDLLLEKTLLALDILLQAGRDAGFTEAGSYDLEIGQNLWWGFPAKPPFPSLTTGMLQPGGTVFQFGQDLIDHMKRSDEPLPTLWWGQVHHRFEKKDDEDLPEGVVGRAISFYDAYTPVGGESWPEREPLRIEGDLERTILARPEGFAADFSKHDNLIRLIQSTDSRVGIPALGIVPRTIPGVEQSGISGWEIKSRSLTRSLMFWLNQGVDWVLLHSFHIAGPRGELDMALVPHITDPAGLRWQDVQTLRTIRSLTDALEGAQPLEQTTPLGFRYALAQNPELIAAHGEAGPMTAVDLLALLPFQVTENRYAVAAYIVTPNILQRLDPITLQLEIDRSLAADVQVNWTHPSSGGSGQGKILTRGDAATILQFPIRDDVTWVIFDVE